MLESNSLSSIGNKIFIGMLGFVSALLIWFGMQLLFLGGSWYYLFAGVTVGLTAFFSIRRSRVALPTFAILYAVTLVWAFWEAGLKGWALAPRLAMFTVLGLWMLSPSYRAHLGLPRNFKGSTFFWGGLATLLVTAVGAVFYADHLSGHEDGPIDYTPPATAELGEWRYYGNNIGGSRYSPLKQITPENVGQLKPVWTYHAGTSGYEPKSMFEGILTIEATPLKIGDRLYFCTGYNDVIALDAETGTEIWRHRTHLNAVNVFTRTCRGVAYYRVPDAAGLCSQRIYTATLDARLIALDADTGTPCPDFGVAGEADLLQGMGVVEKGYYYVTSPPLVIKGRLVLGGWVMDGQHTGEPPGVIRAFDAVSGKFSWAFDTGRPHEHGLPPDGQSFTLGTPNSWSLMSADEELGLVYVPTGNATPDYFGAFRTPNDEKYSSSVVALNAETGEPVWSFQTTHHDLWDYDVASQPTLIDLPDGTKGLLQPTKRGEIFFLDRTNGKPITEVKELPVPQGAAEGDWTSPTQPFSTGLPSFAGPRPSEKNLWGLTPVDQAYCRVKFMKARFDGTLTPVGVDRPTVTWPGYLGGVNWGSVSIDPINQLMIVNSTHVMMYNQLIPRKEADARGIKPVTTEGNGEGKHVALLAAQKGTPYAISSGPFMSLLAVPCQEPPFGLISAVDLKTHSLLWQKPFGTSRDSGPVLLRSYLPIPMGVPNLGGSTTTASGITFIGATQERMIRAYNSKTGEELWRARLPAGGHATPVTYWSAKSNRQFVVIAAGGHGAMLSGHSDALVAFALPEKQ
jgi:quinoprotein glucose dehydrogenase